MTLQTGNFIFSGGFSSDATVLLFVSIKGYSVSKFLLVVSPSARVAPAIPIKFRLLACARRCQFAPPPPHELLHWQQVIPLCVHIRGNGLQNLFSGARRIFMVGSVESWRCCSTDSVVTGAISRVCLALSSQSF